jgi:hypothetical protein
MYPTSLPPTRYLLGTSVLAPICLIIQSWSFGKTHYFIIWFSFGSKSAPPFPPPIGNVVKLFLTFKARISKYLSLQMGENEVHLCRSDSRVHLNTVSSVYLCLSFIINQATLNMIIRSDSTIRSKAFCWYFLFSSIKGITVSATSRYCL